jgi:outer membrane protein TolC
MNPPPFRSSFLGRVLGPAAAVFAFAALPAHALQPLTSFVEAARTHNVDNAEAVAGLEGQKAQADLALGRALPGLGARGVYTRNEIQVPFGPIPGIIDTQVFIQRYNQLDAFLTVNVPLVDLASFQRIGAAQKGTDSAEQQVQATSLQVSAAVAQDYYQLVASQAVVEASLRALDVAQSSLRLAQTRFEAGKGAALDVDLARAEVERQTQLLSAARLNVALAARALESATGVTPDLSAPAPLDDDLHTEATLDTFQRPDEALPAVAAAAIARASSEQQATAARYSLIPSLSGSFLEHGTNASSFIGQAWSYSAIATLNWQLDFTSFATIHAQDAAAAAARAREERTRLQIRDAIHRSWATVDTAIAQSRSARAQQQASTHASQLALARYEAGAATQLELLQAQRDALSADVARIQADANLANSRLQLRLASGVDPFAQKGTP